MTIERHDAPQTVVPPVEHEAEDNMRQCAFARKLEDLRTAQKPMTEQEIAAASKEVNDVIVQSYKLGTTCEQRKELIDIFSNAKIKGSLNDLINKIDGSTFDYWLRQSPDQGSDGLVIKDIDLFDTRQHHPSGKIDDQLKLVFSD